MNKEFRILFSALLTFLCCFAEARAEDWRSDVKRSLKNGGALAVDAKGKVLFAFQADKELIPASITKLVTTAAALHYLGPEFRFETKFWVDSQKRLYVEGQGDPGLLSEELRLIAQALASKVSAVSETVIDDSFFSENVAIDGASRSSNPYDALNGALIANFNTLYLQRTGGIVQSAEPQTPMTDISRRFGVRVRGAKERFNLGPDRGVSRKYFGELLNAFLVESGVRVSGNISSSKTPPEARLVYTHRSSKPLRQICKEMLDYSTNFTANQLFLYLGAHLLSPPATVEKSRTILERFLSQEAKWSTVSLHDGAGLSRKNKVTAGEMVELLRSGSIPMSLIPIEKGHFLAKTGSLTGVSTLAGYFDSKTHGRITFAILVNDSVPAMYKFTVAEKLYRGLQ